MQAGGENFSRRSADENGGILMDAKYLAEIKARDNTELPETAAPVFHDRHALIAEVERLTIENLGLKDAAIRCDGYEKRYHAALTELDVKDQQIVTLKRAMELMSRTACGEMPGTMPEWDMVRCVPDKSCMKESPCKDSDNECHECWMRYFIQQAQEQEADHAE
jgi:hypothetical protein